MPTVHILWIILLTVTVLILPFIVALLHKVYLNAKGIERYFAEMHEAGAGIAENTDHIKALDATISVASGMLEVGGNINEHAATLGGAIADRASKLK